MEREFIQLPEFERQWSRLGLDDDDLAELQEEIKKDPKLGAVIPGTGGVRKMRIAFKGRGKRGSARVLYIDVFIAETILLLGAYAKSEKETLTQEEKQNIKKLAELLKGQYRS